MELDVNDALAAAAMAVTSALTVRRWRGRLLGPPRCAWPASGRDIRCEVERRKQPSLVVALGAATAVAGNMLTGTECTAPHDWSSEMYGGG